MNYIEREIVICLNPHAFVFVTPVDIQMPVMDGYEATRRLRTMGYNNLPIFGLTACVARPDFSELGFDGWLAKPIPMKDLKAKLYQFKPCCASMTLPEKHH